MTDLSKLTDAQVLGLTGAAEARSEFVPGHGWQPAPIESMIACMCTPINRVVADPKRFGATVSDACFEHAQYSCWNAKSGSNHDWLMAQAAAILTGKSIAPIVQQCISAAARLLDGILPDVTNGAVSYYSPPSMVPVGRVPLWARGKTPCFTIGNQFLFFKGV
jgi:hypothetical protein